MTYKWQGGTALDSLERQLGIHFVLFTYIYFSLFLYFSFVFVQSLFLYLLIYYLLICTFVYCFRRFRSYSH